MPAWAETVHGLAVAKEDGFLVLLHDELRPQLDIGATLRRDTMDERAVALVEKLNDFQSNAHEVSPLTCRRTRDS